MSIFATIGAKLASAALGPVLDVVKDLGGKWLSNKATEEELKGALETAMLTAFTGLWASQADVIKAEINSDDKLTRTWRPWVAVSFAFVLVFYTLILPILVSWFGAPPLQTSDTLLEYMSTLLTVCITGYVGGRTAEKIADKFTKGK